MRKLQGRKKDKVKVRTILNAMLDCSKYHHNIFCPINLHLAELSAGLVEGGEQVTGGDRGQADRVHRHHGKIRGHRQSDTMVRFEYTDSQTPC